jgi:hypothetical protein
MANSCFKSPKGGNRSSVIVTCWPEPICEACSTARSIIWGNADLSNACFAGANLYWAFLNRTILRGADLSGACLRGADIEDADLSFANLTGADLGLCGVGRATHLDGANLTGADMTGALLTCAVYDHRTIFPDGFNPKDHGMLTNEEYGQLFQRT